MNTVVVRIKWVGKVFRTVELDREVGARGGEWGCGGSKTRDKGVRDAEEGDWATGRVETAAASGGGEEVAPPTTDTSKSPRVAEAVHTQSSASLTARYDARGMPLSNIDIDFISYDIGKLQWRNQTIPPNYRNLSAPPPKFTPANDPEADPYSYSLEKFRLYETKARFYIIGSDRNKRFFRVLKIDRMEPSDLNISEDPVVYSPQEVKSLLQRIAEGNRATGGLTPARKVYGIAGCIKFIESYYLIMVTKRRQIGYICGHAIYSIDESQLITIPHASIQTDIAHSKNELRSKFSYLLFTRATTSCCACVDEIYVV
ncbi:phosphoinositide phosphatase family protein [Actinidia rufa]|uniref:Phosphoinositide phosphatase family protein n=1 Tax=Actinidia rufa TaxID=165716 RepID=A0A7J0DCP6_9ERIC|nr:phosphoinositide phosphatase family protein [Actinidia rufa]